MSAQILPWSKPASRAHLGNILKDGKIAISTSDTVLGFLAPLSQMGFNKLDYLKKRSNKPYLILMGSKDKLSFFTDQQLSPGLQRLVDSCWPGPVTLIFKAKASLPLYMVGSDGTIAIRVPRHEGLLEILKDFEGLFSTSANLNGMPVPETIDQIDQVIQDAVECIVVEEGDEGRNVPSTILDCTQDVIKVVRDGAFDVKVLEGIVGVEFKKN